MAKGSLSVKRVRPDMPMVCGFSANYFTDHTREELKAKGYSETGLDRIACELGEHGLSIGMNVEVKEEAKIPASLPRTVTHSCPIHGDSEILIPDDMPEGRTFSTACAQCVSEFES